MHYAYALHIILYINLFRYNLLLDFITVDDIINAFWDPVTALEAYV